MAYQPPNMLVPSLVMGGAILVSGLAVKSSLDKSAAQLENIGSGLEKASTALTAVANARPAAAPAPQKRRGPDPNKRYTVKTASRPAKGGKNAKVEIVEFSDFQ